MAAQDDQGAPPAPPPQHPAAPIVAAADAVWKFYSPWLCHNVLTKLQHSIRQKETQVLDQHPFILDCCALSLDLENEIIMTFAYVRHANRQVFPELRSIVENPIVYARIVKAIGNKVKFDSDLLLPLQAEGILTPSMVEAVVAVRNLTSARSRTRLKEIKLKEALETCDKVLALDSLRKKVVAFVESRMGLLAPNLSALVGTAVAAKLLGAAGGLSELSIMPIFNIVFLGVSSSNNGINKQVFLDDDNDDQDGLIFTAIAPLPGFYLLYGTKSPFKGCYLAQRLPSEVCRRLGESINRAAAMDLAGDLVGKGRDQTGKRGRAMGEEIRKMIDERKRKEEEDYAAAMLTKKQAERSTLIGHRKLAVANNTGKFKRIMISKKKRPYIVPNDYIEKLADSLKGMGLPKSLTS